MSPIIDLTCFDGRFTPEMVVDGHTALVAQAGIGAFGQRRRVYGIAYVIGQSIG